MIFLDTNIWFELLAVRTPIKNNEINQARAASLLLNSIQQNNEKIITCKEQLFELIKLIEKVKLKEVNKNRKANNQKGFEKPKDFRKSIEFSDTQKLCISIIKDIKHFANIKDFTSYDIDSILENLHLVDINDYLYYNYCVNNYIDFYTFDNDFKNLGHHDKVHILTT